jgi:hypothetical protein
VFLHEELTGPRVIGTVLVVRGLIATGASVGVLGGGVVFAGAVVLAR